jgi:hypothetical protein
MSSCVYCGRAFSHHLLATVDHLIPVSKGGAHNRANKRPCCHHCNAQKGALLPPDFLAYLLTEQDRATKAATRINLEAKIERVRALLAEIEELGPVLFRRERDWDWYRRRYGYKSQ